MFRKSGFEESNSYTPYSICIIISLCGSLIESELKNRFFSLSTHPTGKDVFVHCLPMHHSLVKTAYTPSFKSLVI